MPRTETPKVKVPHVGVWLANQREKDKVSQEELAKRMGIAQTGVSRIERSPSVTWRTMYTYLHALQREVRFVKPDLRVRKEKFPA